MAKPSTLIGLRLNDTHLGMLNDLVAQQNAELDRMGLAARVGPQDVLRRLIEKAHGGGPASMLPKAALDAFDQPVIMPSDPGYKRPPPATKPIDSSIEYNLKAHEEAESEAFKQTLLEKLPDPIESAPSRPAKGPPKRETPAPQEKVPTPIPAPATTSDEALAEIGLAPEPAPEKPEKKTDLGDDDIAAMLDSV